MSIDIRRKVAGWNWSNPGDQRVAAAGLSLRQDLAGNACVTFSMVADLERATLLHGDRGYRYAYFECGRHRDTGFISVLESLGLGVCRRASARS